MPVNIKRSKIKYKDSTTEQYKTVDIVGERITYDAEAYAKGTRNGVAVGTSDFAYQNNAKYYLEQYNTFRIERHKIIKTLTCRVLKPRKLDISYIPKYVQIQQSTLCTWGFFYKGGMKICL